jgi:hypothetical protein
MPLLQPLLHLHIMLATLRSVEVVENSELFAWSVQSRQWRTDAMPREELLHTPTGRHLAPCTILSNHVHMAEKFGRWQFPQRTDQWSPIHVIPSRQRFVLSRLNSGTSMVSGWLEKRATVVLLGGERLEQTWDDGYRNHLGGAYVKTTESGNIARGAQGCCVCATRSAQPEDSYSYPGPGRKPTAKFAQPYRVSTSLS